jgi:probable rRNA maturation factor
MTKARTLTIDVAVAAKPWREISAARLVTRAAHAAYDAAPSRRKPKGDAELAIVLTTDAAVRRLNKTYRGKDKSTDVLSFPAWSADEPVTTAKAMLGDVVIAHGVTARDAKAASKPLAAHLTHIAVHGVLHLLGYDHMRDDGAAVMERLEISVLKKLGIPNPYESPPAKAARRKTNPLAPKKARR